MGTARTAVLTAAIAAMVIVVAGCGDKVPESQAAKAVGAAPRQTVDRVNDDTARALEQGAQRNRDNAP
jgi:predicted small lipoprotein YifL